MRVPTRKWIVTVGILASLSSATGFAGGGKEKEEADAPESLTQRTQGTLESEFESGQVEFASGAWGPVHAAQSKEDQKKEFFAKSKAVLNPTLEVASRFIESKDPRKIAVAEYLLTQIVAITRARWFTLDQKLERLAQLKAEAAELKSNFKRPGYQPDPRYVLGAHEVPWDIKNLVAIAQEGRERLCLGTLGVGAGCECMVGGIVTVGLAGGTGETVLGKRVVALGGFSSIWSGLGFGFGPVLTAGRASLQVNSRGRSTWSPEGDSQGYWAVGVGVSVDKTPGSEFVQGQFGPFIEGGGSLNPRLNYRSNSFKVKTVALGKRNYEALKGQLSLDADYQSAPTGGGIERNLYRDVNLNVLFKMLDTQSLAALSAVNRQCNMETSSELKQRYHARTTTPITSLAPWDPRIPRAMGQLGPVVLVNDPRLVPEAEKVPPFLLSDYVRDKTGKMIKMDAEQAELYCKERGLRLLTLEEGIYNQAVQSQFGVGSYKRIPHFAFFGARDSDGSLYSIPGFDEWGGGHSKRSLPVRCAATPFQ